MLVQIIFSTLILVSSWPGLLPIYDISPANAEMAVKTRHPTLTQILSGVLIFSIEGSKT